jgi:osmotically-inducible protein OsmY
MQSWMAKRRARARGAGLDLLGLVVAVGLALPPATSLGAVTPETAALDDDAIRSAVEGEYIFDSAVPFHSIDVDVRTGIVTLSGPVDTILARRRAVELARTIRGVRSVVDDLEVKPVARSDDDLRRDIVRALLSDPATDSYQVEVEVKEGVATLRGTVDSWQEKQLVVRVAEGVRGLADVRDFVTFEVREDRHDPEIAAEIRSRLRWDAWVDDGLITVSVDEGEVTLSGAVGSAVEHARAMDDVWVPGVHSVDAGSLEVEWWARDRMRRDKYAMKSDAQIRQAVEDAFLYDPRVMSTRPQVKVNNGMVTLSGVVQDLQARRAAEEDARNTVGVLLVRNHLRVRPAVERSDEEITRQVQEALQRDPLVDRFNVGVTTFRGEVFLSGEVDSWFEEARAENAAAGVPGVVDIRNNLRADGPPEYLSERRLEEEIEDELFWSPFVDAGEVHVSVDGRVATLTGTVDNWADYSWAAENARQGGAASVRNHLKVRNDQGAFWTPFWTSLWTGF